MLSYSEAKEMMQRARNGRRKLENNTYLEERDCGICGEPYRAACGRPDHGPNYAVRLHDTDVVTVRPDGSYTLDSGGWRTVTTKDRMNRYSPHRVYSEKGMWYAYPVPQGDFSGWKAGIPFADGMRIYPDGRVVGAGIDETAIRAQLLKQIRAYVDGFAKHAVKHGLAAPSGGDCWGCAMVRGRPWGQDKATKPGADHAMGLDHIFEHFRERYYVPGLLWRALQRRGNPQFCYQLMQQEVARGDARMLKQELRAYFKTLMPALVAAKVAELERAA